MVLAMLLVDHCVCNYLPAHTSIDESNHEQHRHRPTDRHLEHRSLALAHRLQRQAPRHLDRARRVRNYELAGDLTLRGITKPITLTAEIGGAETDAFGNDRIGLEATGSLNRSDYGMKFNQALGSGNLAVSDKVKLVLDISAVRGS